jgi:NAD(P)-dependent dehydrogenase (short-subunit alcohol dehydrogenase family)
VRPSRDGARAAAPARGRPQSFARAHCSGRAAPSPAAGRAVGDALAGAGCCPRTRGAAAHAGLVAAADGVHDLRASNSWTLRLGEVATAECLEVLLINAAAPFVLAGRLRDVMARDALADKWIVNVAAVEGQFSRRQKDARHPHLNMAKAALNMLTRSAAADYARDRIYMNSVDVGWFSNGEPAAVAARCTAAASAAARRGRRGGPRVRSDLLRPAHRHGACTASC